jgi:hypothetical protein
MAFDRAGGGGKLHLGIDAVTHEIVASELTADDVADVSEMPALLYLIDAEVASMTADGAYDGEAIYDAVGRTSSGSRGDVVHGCSPQSIAALVVVATSLVELDADRPAIPRQQHQARRP